MKSVDNEIENYRFRFNKHLVKTKNSILPSEYSQSPSPVSFLEQFSVSEEKTNSIVEEIFQRENSRFYNRALESYSVSPTKPPTRLETSFSEHSKKHKNSSLLPKRNSNFPCVGRNKSQKKVFVTNRKTHMKIERFVEECDEMQKTISENSGRFNEIMSKERRIAKNYSRDLQWTSKKLVEINGYEEKVVNALYEEHKGFHEAYEREKRALSKRYNTRTLEDYKRKVEHIKTLLVTYKNKIIP